MTYSQDCLDVAKEFEGCKLEAYDDLGGVPTIGYGHTGLDVHIGLIWTQAQADAQLAADLQIHCEQMQRAVKVLLTQGQTDALTDFVYNVGIGTFERSTLLATLNAGRYKAIPDLLCHRDEDDNWHGFVFAAGKVQSGLVRRRQAEIALWNKP